MSLWFFLYGVLLWLGWYDLEGQRDVAALYEQGIIVAAPAHAEGCARYLDGQILIDLPCSTGYSPSEYAWPNDEKWWSCVMVHEAEHAKLKGLVGERQPMARQLLCLQRLGAPQGEQDYIAGLIEHDWPGGAWRD